MNFCGCCGAKINTASAFVPLSSAAAAPYTRPLPPQQSGENSSPQPAAAAVPYQTARAAQLTNPLPPTQPDALQYPPAVIPQSSQIAVPTIQPAPQGKSKDKWTALLLCFFLGTFGAHKYYEGKIGIGLLYLLAFWLMGFFTLGLSSLLICLLCLIDFIVLLCKPNPYDP